MGSKERGDEVLFPARDGMQESWRIVVLGQFSFRASESLTLRTTNEKKNTKNRQLPRATQAKYTLIDLSVQVRSTVVQIYISLITFMQSLYNITLQLYLQLLIYLADTSLSGETLRGQKIVNKTPMQKE